MPKMKTHSGAKKRFKKTAGGKVKKGRAGRRHLLGNKSPSQKRSLRASSYVADSHAVHMQQLLPNG